MASLQQNVDSAESIAETIEISGDNGGPDGAAWRQACASLESAIRDMVEQMKQLQQENLNLRAELRQARLRESGLREERAAMLRDLVYSLDTIESILDTMAVRE